MFWSVVQSEPMNERRALMHLERYGFTTYAPREKISRVRRGRKFNTARWLFPRYLFIWIEDNWQRVFSIYGITKLLMTGEQPAKLPERFITDLKARERNGLITLSKHRFTKGQEVTVTGGLFAGAKGLYQCSTSRQREVILMSALGRVELASGLLRES